MKLTMVLLALAASTVDAARIKKHTSEDGVVEQTQTGTQKAEMKNEETANEEEVNEAKCTVRLNRFKKMNVKDKAVTFALTKDPFFPADESSIGMKTAKYDNWVDMKTASKTMWGSEVLSIFDAATGEPAAADVQQGEVGNCYFLAAILSIAHTRPEIIKDMFVRPELWDKNIVTTKWLLGGMETLVEVDTTIPFSKKNNRPWFAGPSETKAWWPSILEKTWAKIFTSYEATTGGQIRIVVGAITQAPTVTVDHSSINVAAASQNMEKKSIHWSLLLSATKNKWPMFCGATPSSGTPFGLANNHAYVLLEAIEDNVKYADYGGRVCKVMNPWNKGFYNGAMASLLTDTKQTGVFLMKYDEFLQSCLSTDFAKVYENYHVTSSELTPEMSLQASYKFTTTQDKPFFVSVVWPSRRMMAPCTALNPQPNVALTKLTRLDQVEIGNFIPGENDAFADASQVEKFGKGSYRMVASIKFPKKNDITSAYINIYAAELVDVYPSDFAFPKLALGMLGANVGGNPCSTVTFDGKLWAPNYALTVGGVATYEDSRPLPFTSMAYFYAKDKRWLTRPQASWPADGSRYGAGSAFASTSMKCGCGEDGVGSMDGGVHFTNELNEVTGWFESKMIQLVFTCAEVEQQSRKSVNCGVAKVAALCPVTCGVECRGTPTVALQEVPAPAPSRSNGQGPSPATIARPTTEEAAARAVKDKAGLVASGTSTQATYEVEGQGYCKQREAYASRAWELADSKGGKKEFDTSEYKSWVTEAWSRCLKKDAQVKFVSVWTDAGYRCYRDATCTPNGAGNTKSWRMKAGPRLVLIPIGGAGGGSDCAAACIWDDSFCVNKYGQCGILESQVEAICGAWNDCAGVVCKTGYGGYCLARRTMSQKSTHGMWGYTKSSVAAQLHDQNNDGADISQRRADGALDNITFENLADADTIHRKTTGGPPSDEANGGTAGVKEEEA